MADAPNPSPAGQAHRNVLTNFYREEFVKHFRCLETQREYYSEQAIREAEAALCLIISQVEQLCINKDVDEVVSRLLRKFDLVTGLSARTDPRNTH